MSPAVVLIGENDGLLGVVDEAAERLTGFGLAIHRVPGLEHEFPQDFGERLAEVLPGIDA